MARRIRHNKVAVSADKPGAEINKTEWNEDHVVEIKLDELDAPTDVVTLNSSTTAHGLLKKLSGAAGEYMGGDGNWSTPPAGSPADNSITNAKLSDMATKTYKGRTSGGTGDPEDVAVATLKSDLVLVKGDVGLGNVDNTSDANKPVSTAQQTAMDAKVEDALVDAVTTKAPSQNAVFDALAGKAAVAHSHDTSEIVNDAVTNVKLANMATKTYKGRTSALTGDPEDVSAAQLKADLSLDNVNNTSDASKPVSTATATAIATAVTDHEAAADPHTGYQKESEKNAVSGYPGLDGSSKLTGSQQKYGTLANTACEGNDARLSDSRTPTAHAASHKSGGSDPIKLDELAAPTDVTTLDASTSAHGLMKKYPGGTTDFLRADGAFAAPVAALPDLIQIKLVVASAAVINAGYGSIYPDELEISDTFSLEVGAGSILEVT